MCYCQESYQILPTVPFVLVLSSQSDICLPDLGFLQLSLSSRKPMPRQTSVKLPTRTFDPGNNCLNSDTSPDSDASGHGAFSAELAQLMNAGKALSSLLESSS